MEILLLALLFSTGGADRVQGDTVDVLVAAMEEYLRDARLDSAAVDIEEPAGGWGTASSTMLRSVALRIGLPAVKRSQVLRCPDGAVALSDCGYEGYRRLLSVYPDAIGENVAVVSVSNSQDYAGAIYSEGVQYLLRRASQGWVVERALMHSAS